MENLVHHHPQHHHQQKQQQQQHFTPSAQNAPTNRIQLLQQQLQQQQQQYHPPTYEDILKERGYKLGRTLGSGSYAKVKEAEYRSAVPNEPRVMKMAVKIIDKKKAPKDFLDRFLPRELEIIKQIEHPNIIKVYQIEHIGSKDFIFMEIAEGGDLLDYIKKNGALQAPMAKRMFYELASAVRYIHNLQITHRDLKCENLLLDRDNHIKLADFGFARSCMDNKTQRRILSQTYCGSAAYAAPEILKGQPYNPKLYDIWSLGVILFIMVCGSMPYDDRDVKKMLETQLKGKVKFPSRVQDKLEPSVVSLINSMLEVDVTKRYNIDKVHKHAWLNDVAKIYPHSSSNTTPTTMQNVIMATTGGSGGKQR